MAATPELVVDCRSALLENALWVPETGLLWFLDLLGPAVHRYDPATRRHDRHKLGGTKPVGCLVRGPGHESFLLARREGVFRVDPSSFVMTFWTDPNARSLDVACNDGKIGPDGALWLCTDDLAAPWPRCRPCSRSPARSPETSAPARSWSARRSSRPAANAACRRQHTPRSAAADGCRRARGHSRRSESPPASGRGSDRPGTARRSRTPPGTSADPAAGPASARPPSRAPAYVLASFTLPGSPDPSTRLSVVESQLTLITCGSGHLPSTTILLLRSSIHWREAP